MNLQVLIPTFRKSRKEIFHLCEALNVQTDAIIANQNGKNEEYTFLFKDHTISVICTNTVGVSINRNILLDNAKYDLNLMIDDDCRLVDEYEKKVLDFFEINKCSFAVFNGLYVKNNNHLVHYKKSRKINHFFQISYAGGPGFCFRENLLENLKIKYNTSVGTPNYICAGEDSLFYYDLVRKKTNFFRSSIVIFQILNDKMQSSYFSGINEQYVNTRGFITAKIHKNFFNIYMLRHCIRFKRENKSLKIRTIFKWFKNGRKLYEISNESSFN